MFSPHHPETPGPSGVSDEQLVRYILGLLPESETERLDEASIADDEVAERLRIVEDDLVDAYVRGALDPATLERFESYYLSSPERREHVRFAASLVRSVDRAAPPPRSKTATGASTAQSVAATLASSAISSGTSESRTWSVLRRRALPGLAAAALLMLAASATLLYEATRLNQNLTVERQRNAALDQRVQALEDQLDMQRTSAAAAQIELTRSRESGTSATPPAARSGAPVVAAPAIALVLLPQTRAIGPIPALALSRGAERVAFDLRLETNDFREYKVGLRDPATNNVIWRSDWIAPRTFPDQASVSLTVPAGLLKAQHYAIELTGRDGTDRGQVVGSYAFQIVPR
ncbi:MAG TPA: hypothetical protein VH497_12115 [Vicinamibacterales bacterium]|jgi:hypothetical protein